MKLKINQEELEAGLCVRRFGEKRSSEIKLIATSKEFVPINPIPHKGRMYSIIILTKFQDSNGNKILSFIPLPNRCFVTWIARPAKISLITLETEEGQMSFDSHGFRKTSYSTNGPGCDPESVIESQTMLSRLISSNGRDEPLKRLIEYYKQWAILKTIENP